MADEHQHHVVDDGRARCGKARHRLKAWIAPDDAFPQLGHQPDWDASMIPKTRTDTRKIHPQRYTKCLDLALRTDPGSQEDSGRTDCAGGQDNALSILDLTGSFCGKR
jgi:hypothetical protein